jgi:hypothetical protein
MSTLAAKSDNLIGRVTREVVNLPTEDLSLVVEFVEYLKHRPHATSPRPTTASEIRAAVRHRASELETLPRAEIVQRFQEVAESIRQQAIIQGRAVDGDWCGD